VVAVAVVATTSFLLGRPAPSEEPSAPAAAPTASTAATTTAPTTTTTTTTTTTVAACRPDPALFASATDPDAAPLRATLEAAMTDPRFAAVTASASVWVQGYGEVLAHAPDVALLPASNQKLLTALGVHALLPADGVFTTTVRAAGAVRPDGTLDGDLVLVGGGDPTLTRAGPHSLDARAAQGRAAGIARVTGALVVDERRQEAARAGPGWQDWQIPTYAGPLSALTVDDNRYRTDVPYLADPALGNAEAFAGALRRHGVSFDGAIVHGVGAVGSSEVASLRSADFATLAGDMLLRSDNETAEMLLREVSTRAGGGGATLDGATRVSAAIETMACLDLDGVSSDGSGLSRGNFRSARELRRILQAAASTELWAPLDAALPIAGQTGTLARRFGGTNAAGNVHAKTGSIIGGRALTGHLRTAGGRRAYFSIVVNGEGSGAALAAIDALVVTLSNDAS
jgi:D-alanyl-D-alanine carboxypeptidase/D-alanyl-D-alanine-endopeptidase (penicillin-binding protein 4)